MAFSQFQVAPSRTQLCPYRCEHRTQICLVDCRHSLRHCIRPSPFIPSDPRIDPTLLYRSRPLDRREIELYAIGKGERAGFADEKPHDFHYVVLF